MTDQTAPAAAAEASPGTEYTLFTVVRRDPHVPADGTSGARAALAAALDGLPAGVTLRGVYDVSGLRADADLMFWLHAPAAQDLQAAWRTVRSAGPLAATLPTWNAMGVHRDAEFNRAHVPAFLRGLAAKDWLVVYPFVRSYEWYLLPEAERSAMLRDHGRKGAAFRGVLANTIASFALGDYEWLLPMEADELTDLVDMMRELRYTEARRHVREEVPFYTGRRLPGTAEQVADAAAAVLA